MPDIGRAVSDINRLMAPWPEHESDDFQPLAPDIGLIPRTGNRAAERLVVEWGDTAEGLTRAVEAVRASPGKNSERRIPV